MKTGFFGTPEIGAFCLRALAAVHEILFAAVPEDKPAGRSRKPLPCPVKTAAMELGIPVLQPHSLKDPEFISAIKGFNAEIFTVVAYGKIIPPEIYLMPELKTINLHPSLLPLYRGAAPIPWSLINGEKESGITVQLINEKMDAGDIVLQEKIPLTENMTAGDLFGQVLPKGAELLLRAMDLLSAGNFSPVPQDHSRATFCTKITRETEIIDWQKSARTVHNLVRGLNPKPYARTVFRGSELKIIRTSEAGQDEYRELNPLPGEFAVFRKKRLIAGTGSGPLEILELQPENKKIMDAGSFINGYRLLPGEKAGVL